MIWRWLLIRAATALTSASVVSQNRAADRDVHRRIYSLGDLRLESGLVLQDAKLTYGPRG